MLKAMMISDEDKDGPYILLIYMIDLEEVVFIKIQ